MNAPFVQTRLLSYNDRLGKRCLGGVHRAVIHATELPDLETARVYGERIRYPASGTGNSGHFYIDRDGRIEQWVTLDRIAHHVAGHNADTLGIELVNRGRYPDWFDSRRQQWPEPVTEEQIKALAALLNSLRPEIDGLRAIAGHDQLDQRRVPASDDPSRQVRRKLDPGPDFPWDRVCTATGLALIERSDGAA
ncbi:MAG: N-acetylmuramoyl-L-alanine amidase [Gammaproteobacteria bacterium]|jgi:N-acetylmuramoyl-L-alanine amidase|nr:N-acetylmuramoyl-L-alanine amidase [Gammaproteobacteria bacterium]